METRQTGPRCSLEPPPVDCTDLPLLRYLLEIERERLQTAVRIEGLRQIVFPETTIIIRDIQKLAAQIEKLEGGDGKAEGVVGEAVEHGDPETILLQAMLGDD